MAGAEHYGHGYAHMNRRALTEALKEAGIADLRTDEPMAKHTTFRTGGPADLMILPHSEEQIAAALRIVKDLGIPAAVIGRGSNLLVSDAGFRGAVIKLGDGCAKIVCDGNTITAASGAPLAAVSAAAAENNLSGLEFANGIPGSIGGAAVMNAGAYGCEMKDIFASAQILTNDLAPKTYGPGDMDFGYRRSSALYSGDILLRVTLSLQKGDRREIRRITDDLNRRRREKQPLQYPSAGSTFKRPPGHFAGALIEQCGLKGVWEGGAQVSEKHAGFIVNRGNATSADIYRLIERVKETTAQKTGVMLEPEIRFIGEFE